MMTLREGLLMSLAIAACDPPDTATIDVEPAVASHSATRPADRDTIVSVTRRIALGAGMHPTAEWQGVGALGQFESDSGKFYLAVRQASSDSAVHVEILHSWQRFPQYPTRRLYGSLRDSLVARFGKQRVRLSD